jgi:hypothetical protein
MTKRGISSSHRKSSRNKTQGASSRLKTDSIADTTSKLQSISTRFSAPDETSQDTSTSLSLYDEIYPDLQHDIRGIGSQFSYAANGLPQNPAATMTYLSQAYTCPYHGPVLEGRTAVGHGQRPSHPMQRYLACKPWEQHALFHCPDTGLLSTSKGCKCGDIMEGDKRDHIRDRA